MADVLTFRGAVLAAYVTTRHRQFASREALESWQARRLRSALRRARRLPYYADVASDDLAAFPVMDKATFLDHFADLNAAGLRLEDCLAAARTAESHRRFDAEVGGLAVGLSSGTSGRQGVFLTSRAEQARWAGTVLAKALPDGILGSARVALVLRAGGPLYSAVNGGRVAFGFCDLYEPVEEIAATLEQFAPTALAAPPGMLDLLAERRASGRLRIAPRLVYSIADVLDPDVAERVGEAFGVRVGQVYQATEGFLGITCAAGTLHLNEDLAVIETEPAGPGRFTPVVTDLYRTSQAVVRYRLDDVLVTCAGCTCGSPLRTVARIEGRSDDVLRLRALDGGEAYVFADLVRGAVLGAGVRDFTATHATPDTIRLAVDPADRWPEAAAALRSALAARGLVSPGITPEPYLPPDPTTKRRRVRRDW